MNLVAGQRYAIICIFKDNKDAKHHYDLGMTKVVTVTKGGTVGMRAREGDRHDRSHRLRVHVSREQSAEGRHTFVMHNSGKMRHELDFYFPC